MSEETPSVPPSDEPKPPVDLGQFSKLEDTGPYLPPAQEAPSTPEDAPEVAKRFNSLFDDLMLAHMSDVKQFENIPGRPTASLILDLHISGERYTVGLREAGRSATEASDFRPSELYTRAISLQRIDEGKGREHWSYRLGSDGVIRRFDIADSSQKVHTIDSVPRDASDRKVEATQSAIDEVINTTIPNNRLEEDMGINNQPVSNDDIDGLIGFIGTA